MKIAKFGSHQWHDFVCVFFILFGLWDHNILYNELLFCFSVFQLLNASEWQVDTFHPICFFPFCFWLVPEVFLLELSWINSFYDYAEDIREDMMMMMPFFTVFFSIWWNLCLRYEIRTQNSIFIWKIKWWCFWPLFMLCSLTIFNSAYITGVSVSLLFRHPPFILWSENWMEEDNEKIYLTVYVDMFTT